MECLIRTWNQATHEADGEPVGSVILVKPDNHPWSDTELTEFFVARFPDDDLTESGWENITKIQEVERDNDLVILRQRRYVFDLDSLTPARKRFLLNRIDKHQIMNVTIPNELTIPGDLIDLEAVSPRFQEGDLITSGSPV